MHEGVVKVEWTETCRYSAYVRLPEGVTFDTLNQDDYDLENDLGEINTDANFEGLERSDIEIYNQQPATRLAEIEEIEWTPVN